LKPEGKGNWEAHGDHSPHHVWKELRQWQVWPNGHPAQPDTIDELQISRLRLPVVFQKKCQGQPCPQQS
jgi:hypothetical protein